MADSFDLLRDIYRVDGSAYRRTLGRLTESLNLGELLRTPARQLSLGLYALRDRRFAPA